MTIQTLVPVAGLCLISFAFRHGQTPVRDSETDASGILTRVAEFHGAAGVFAGRVEKLEESRSRLSARTVCNHVLPATLLGSGRKNPRRVAVESKGVDA